MIYHLSKKYSNGVQSYALYPHMTVFDNMAFGLKLEKDLKMKLMKELMKKLVYYR